MKEKELIEKAIEWFDEFNNICQRLTTDNVLRLKSSIRGKAVRAAEFIRKNREHNTELLTLTECWFDSVADHATRLTTGNVSHQGATIRCFARDAASLLRKEIKEI